MQPIFFLFLLLVASFGSKSIPHPKNSEIHHVAFLKDKLFFMTKSERQFGVLSIEKREVLTEYKLDQEQMIIKVNTTQKTMILRKDRNKVHLFKLDQLDIEEINVEIAFKHQKIIDLLQSQQHLYVVTQKDVRMYPKNDEEKLQLPKHIIASGRKREIFRKIFIQNQAYLTLILSKDQQICLRKIYPNKTVEQNCLFNVSSQVIQIDRLGSNILIQTKNLNYLIRQNRTFYSFKAEISQLDSRYVVVSNQFKTLCLEKEIFVQGLAVIGSDASNQFWIKHQQGKLVLVHNELTILPLDNKTITRTWISTEKDGFYYFLLQYGRNNLILYKLKKEESWSANIKWTFEEYEQPRVEQL